MNRRILGELKTQDFVLNEMISFTKLANKAQYLPPEKLALVEAAFEYASKAHEGQVRKSGEPYLEHPLEVAIILAELQLDASTLAAALLHDVPEDCKVPIAEIESKFSPEVAKLVDGTTRLDKITRQTPGEEVKTGETQAENLRKMLVAMAEDLRVVFIKLADRLHNMSTLDALPPQRQRSIAKETLEIYAPLANRLGIWELKWQLEDLAFRFLEPEKYHQLARLIVNRRAEREEFINQVIGLLKVEFEKAGRKATISGRPKHIYSVYQKMQRYAAIGKDFDDIHDLLALRVIVSTISDCYAAMGVVHNLWHPLPDSFNDYIANPKPNGYQSLHTTIMCRGTTPLEIQIRTREMHYMAEHGMASHWRYKEGEKKSIGFEQRIAWLRQLIEWHREFSGAEEFLESAKTDIFIDQVFVFTPKGEIKELPKGATPLDFAYRVHTELGHHCAGAKVNGRMVPFNYQLKNGDVVEILTTKEDRGPSLDWLSPNLGYVQTAHAKTKIRQWFKKQERVANIEHGRKTLEKELRHLGIRFTEEEKLAKQFKYDNLEDFFEAIGGGSLTTHQITLKLAAQEQPQMPTTAPTQPRSTPAITVLGTGDLLTQIARCCHPVPGDRVIGYVTRTRGVTIHRQDCYNIRHQSEKERLVSVEWGQTDSVYPVNIEVEAWDRIGLIRDISTILADEKINITTVSSTPHSTNNTVTVFFTLETSGLAQLSRLLAKVEGIQGITSAIRVGDKAVSSP